MIFRILATHGSIRLRKLVTHTYTHTQTARDRGDDYISIIGTIRKADLHKNGYDEIRCDYSGISQTEEINFDVDLVNKIIT